MADRAPEDIVAELARRTRRFRPFLIVGLTVLFLSLVASVVYLNLLLDKERESRRLLEGSLQALLEGSRNASGENRQQLAKAAQQAEAAAAGQRPQQVPLERLDVRLWSCHESDPRNRLQAEALHKLQPDGAATPWRRSDLSVEANSRSNYRLTDTQIRYNPEEEDAADRLQRMMRENLGVEARKVLTFYPTPNSVSVFFCGGANPAPASPGETADGAAKAR